MINENIDFFNLDVKGEKVEFTYRVITLIESDTPFIIVYTENENIRGIEIGTYDLVDPREANVAVFK